MFGKTDRCMSFDVSLFWFDICETTCGCICAERARCLRNTHHDSTRGNDRGSNPNELEAESLDWSSPHIDDAAPIDQWQY